MNSDLKSKLAAALVKLEAAYREIESKQGYHADVESLKILIELTREQVPNENLNHTAR